MNDNNKNEPKNFTNQKVYGIDLGTTTTCISILIPGEGYKVLYSAEGHQLTPSVVHFAGENEMIVGEPALTSAALHPESTIYAAKRFMGKTYEEVKDKEFMKKVPYKVINYKEDIGIVPFKSYDVDSGKSVFTPQFIAALILKKVVEDANVALGEKILNVVVTIPAHFNTKSRHATDAAIRAAGLTKVAIVNEPTAAALAFGQKGNVEGKVLVYDFGGGTFDVTILEVMKGDGDEIKDNLETLYKVITSDGESYLGGEDIDNLLTDYCISEFLKTNKDVNPSKVARGTTEYLLLKEKCKAAKESLNSSASKNSARVTAANFAGKMLDVQILISKFEELIKPLVDLSIKCVDRAFQSANMSRDQIDHVVLVGGSTRLKLVRKELERLFGSKVRTDVHPDQAVSIGAAIYGSVFSGQNKNLVLIDGLTHSLGIESVGGIMSHLLKRNTPLPASTKKVFTTVADNQTSAEIVILEGERTMTSDNVELGRFTLDNIPRAKRGVPQIEVTIHVDVSGLCTVTAYNPESNSRKQVTLHTGAGYTEEEEKKMLEEIEKYKEYDQNKLKSVNLQNDYSFLVYDISRELANCKDEAKAQDYQTKIKELEDKFSGAQEFDFDIKQDVLAKLRTIFAEVAQFNTQNNPASESTEAPKDSNTSSSDENKDDENKSS